MKQKSYDALNRLSVEDYKGMEKLPVVIVLDNLRSGLNIGSAFRTADAFAVTSIELCGICATPPNREILKTALGATESVQWRYHDSTADCIRQLKTVGYSIFAVETATNSVSLEKIVFGAESKTAIVFGNEVKGIDEAILTLCDGAIEIPQLGTKHSFNVSVSLGIVMWEYFRQIKVND